MRAVSLFGPGKSESGVGLTGSAAGVGPRVETTGGEVGEGDGARGDNWGGTTASGGGFGAIEGSSGGGNLFDGGRSGSWIRTVSRDFVVRPGSFVTDCDGRTIRTVSFFGSFGSAIGWVNRSRNIARKSLRCHSLSSFPSIMTSLRNQPGVQARRSYPRLAVIRRQMNSPTGAALDKMTRVSISGASASLRATCG